jgi:hypothetical protein
MTKMRNRSRCTENQSRLLARHEVPFVDAPITKLNHVVSASREHMRPNAGAKHRRVERRRTPSWRCLFGQFATGGPLVFYNDDRTKLALGQFHEVLWAAQKRVAFGASSGTSCGSRTYKSSRRAGCGRS